MGLLNLNNKTDNQDTDALLAIHPALRLKISPRAKRIALRLDTASHQMNLVVPKRFSMNKALDFAWKHQEWIEARLGELPQKIAFADGQIIPFLGSDHKLNINFDSNLKRMSICLNNNDIIVSTNQSDPSLRLKRFLKKEAQDTMANLAHEKAATISQKISAVQIRDTKSRWGSCSPEGKIMLSWRLVFAPWDAMDYVVAHEVAHLEHMNHGKEFWSLCESLCDDYKFGKKWMRANGQELMRYG